MGADPQCAVPPERAASEASHYGMGDRADLAVCTPVRVGCTPGSHADSSSGSARLLIASVMV